MFSVIAEEVQERIFPTGEKLTVKEGHNIDRKYLKYHRNMFKK